MKLWRVGQWLGLIVLIGLGCGGANPSTAKSDKSDSTAALSTNASKTNIAAAMLPQPRLPVIRLFVGNEVILSELALSEKEIMTGMMHRTSMEENEGMLFVFAVPHQASFWMKNTLLPLSCAYIDSEGVILEVHDMKPLDETPIKAESNRVQYVLEMKQGWFERHKIAPGALIRTEKGSLQQSFFRAQP